MLSFEERAHRLEIGRVAFIDGDDDEARDGQFLDVQTGAEPGLEQAGGRRLVDHLAALRADEGQGDIARLDQGLFHVQTRRPA